MSDVKVNSVQPSEASKELVALFLLGSVAQAEGAIVNSRDGIPYIESGMSKKDILRNYLDCRVVVGAASGTREFVNKLPD